MKTKRTVAVVAGTLAVVLIGGGSAESAESERVLTLDRSTLHAQAIEESCRPIRPGIPGQRPFWNQRAGSFIYAPAFEFEPVQGAKAYRFTVTAGGKDWTFEADEPWAALSPVWKELPVGGQISVKVEGLDRKGGQPVGVALIDKRKARQFERRAPFNGPYNEAAYEYTDAGRRWLKWLADQRFSRWKEEGDPTRLGQFPCKDETAAVEGLTAAAVMEQDPAKRDERLQKARNAARTLIKGSFPADWALAGLPPTYGARNEKDPCTYGTVMMPYPATAANVYLDLHEATKEKEFLDATVRIAEAYKKTQLPSGTWHLLMEGKTGEKTARSTTFVMPFEPIRLFDRLARDYGMKEYEPLSRAAWKWVEENPLAKFRFEGQFEDTTYGGGDTWRLSHFTAESVVAYLVRHAKDDPSYGPLAEEVMRWAEDQFVFWETPPSAKDKTPRVPRVEEQHTGACDFADHAHSSDMTGIMIGYQAIYELTGKELYLAKAVAMANAVTLYQKECGGNYAHTPWKTGFTGAFTWPNCHVYNARNLLGFGRMLEERKLRVKVDPGVAEIGK
jgi:maltose/maltodextrin transport system substrate-binding protein